MFISGSVSLDNDRTVRLKSSYSHHQGICFEFSATDKQRKYKMDLHMIDGGFQA